jgi:uncharacterized membrane protein
MTDAAASPSASVRENRSSDLGRRLDPMLLFAGFFTLYATHSVMRHVRYETGGYDLGIFTQAVARYARLQAPIAELKGPGANLLGDHFHPILVTIAPLYRVFPSPSTLLVAQAALLAISVPIVYRTARMRASRTASLVLAVCYGSSWGIAGAVAYDFHEVAFAVPLLALAIDALLRDSFRAAAVWSCGLVLVKEDLPLTTAMFGVLLFWAGARRLGLAVAGFGIAAFGLLVGVVIPRLNAVGEFSYWDRAAGDGGEPSSVTDLALGAAAPAKLLGILFLLLPVAFLALFSRISLLALPTLAWHLLADNPAYSGTQYHYGLVLMPIIFLAAADALRRLPSRAVLVGLAAMVLAGIWFTVTGPYPRMLDPGWWQRTPYAREAAAAVATVPSGATVAAQNRLAPHLLPGREVHLFDTGLRDAYGRIIDVEYVVAETTSGSFPIPPAERRLLLADLQRCGYQEIYARHGFVTLRRTAGAPRGAALAACMPEPPGPSPGR